MPQILLDSLKSLRNPSHNPPGKELWLFYEGEPPDKGSVSIFNNHFLRAGVEAGELYLYFYPYDARNNRWLYARTLTQPARKWDMQVYNRLGFWLYVPSFVNPRSDGGFNFHFSWFTRSLEAAEATPHLNESNNGKWYSYFNVFPDTWQYVEIDLCHPHHRRNNQTKEWGVMQRPPNERLWMSDLMTAFYLEAKNIEYNKSRPWNYGLSNVRFFSTPPELNNDDVYSPVIARKHHKVFISWSKRRDLREEFEFRWSHRTFASPSTWKRRSFPFEEERLLSGNQEPHNYNGLRWEGKVQYDTNKTLYVAMKPKHSPVQKIRWFTLPAIPPWQ